MAIRLTLTAPQVIEAVRELERAKLAERTLGAWAERGIVEPSVQWDRIRGVAHRRIYNLADLARIRLVVVIINLIFTSQTPHRYFRRLPCP